MWNLIYKHNNRVWLTYKKPGVLWTALWCRSLTSHAPSLLYLTFSTTAQSAREDLVPLSTHMSGLTDNTGLTDCSIIAR